VDSVTAPVTVTGGAASIAADFEDLRTAAGIVGSAVDSLSAQALVLHRDLLDGIGLGAALDPVGAAHFEAAMAAALDGPNGMAVVVAEVLAMQVALTAAAEAYLAADQLRTSLAPYAEVVLHSPVSAIVVGGDLLHGRRSAAWQDLLTENPYLVDVASGLIPANMPLPFARMTSPAGAGLGLLYPDGRPVIVANGVQTHQPPPRSTRDLTKNLLRADNGTDGEITVQVLDGVDANGSRYRKVIVNIPGTKKWNRPGADTDVADLGSDIHALDGETTTYEKGVIAALHAAGVTRADDITLVGHSLGGIVAVNAARDLAAEGQNVTHVITAGSPISRVVRNLPSSVQVMAIENRGDLVPHADGAANPDRGNVTTVTVDHDHHSIGANHDLERSYLPGAADIDASDDPSISAYRRSLSGQLNAQSATTYSYVVKRAH